MKFFATHLKNIINWLLIVSNNIQPIFFMFCNFFPHLLQNILSLFTNCLSLLLRGRQFSKGCPCLIKEMIFFDCFLGKFLLYLRYVMYQLINISFYLISRLRLHSIFILLCLFTLINFINIFFALFFFGFYIFDKFLII